MKFRVLGPLELWDAGQRVDLAGAKQQAMLALLLLSANQPVSRERLTDALWNGAPPPSAAATVHSLVYCLRKLFESSSRPGEVSLVRTALGYVLRIPEDAIDLHEFEQAVADGRPALERGDLRAALAVFRAGLDLWRGDAFAGIDVTEVRERAAALADRRLDVIELRMTAQLELGDNHALIAELEQEAGRHPFRERLWELLMTALYRSGRQADALEAYQRLYRLLNHELGIQPRPSVRELHQRMLSGAPELDSCSRVLVPRLLPVAVRDFTGRATQLRTLDALLPASPASRPSPASPATAVISVISGMAGIGKTTLAVHWAHRVADRFPDGQLYVNLRGFDPARRPLSPADALRGLLPALGLEPARIPEELDARAGLYRSRLAGTRTLVILDNAANEEQVRPLLPAAPGCLVVVTSRNRLTGLLAAEAALPLPLDLLPDAEAYELLARRFGHDRVAAEAEAARSIVSSCGRLPLALAVTTARAAARPGLPLSRWARQLRGTEGSLVAFTGGDPATDVRTVFSWSYDQLSPGAARLFQVSGLHPGPHISVPAAASLAGMPVDRATALLDELVRAHLMTELPVGRFTAHDLLRAYAAELAADGMPVADQWDALHRLLDHYVHTAHAAARLTGAADSTPAPAPVPSRNGAQVSPLAGYEEAMAWLAGERRAVLAAMHLAERSGFDAHAWQLAAILVNVLGQGHRHDHAAALEAALAAARRLQARAELKKPGAFPVVVLGSVAIPSARLHQRT